MQASRTAIPPQDPQAPPPILLAAARPAQQSLRPQPVLCCHFFKASTGNAGLARVPRSPSYILNHLEESSPVAHSHSWSPSSEDHLKIGADRLGLSDA